MCVHNVMQLFTPDIQYSLDPGMTLQTLSELQLLKW